MYMFSEFVRNKNFENDTKTGDSKSSQTASNSGQLDSVIWKLKLGISTQTVNELHVTTDGHDVGPVLTTQISTTTRHLIRRHS